jgi:Zn-dependent peptidase ImmA (M78 family)
MITVVNPKIITWARERKGLTVEDIAQKMKQSPDEVQKWEAGKKTFSYTSLETLAKHFKIPLAVFFFPEPPNIEDPVGKFRRLSEHELERLSSDTRDKIQLAQAYQDSLSELVDKPLFERIIHRDLNPKNFTTKKFASEVRKYLGITLDQQFNFRGYEQAFKAWRHAVENVGVFTFKDSFKDRFVSGFCLIHEKYPVIMVNNSNAFSRQIFTLIHEIGHILFGVNGITDIDDSYIQFMASAEQSLEVKCNHFAAEVLVPDIAFRSDIQFFRDTGPDIIPEIANKYSVSREFILRRLLNHGAISQQYYEKQSVEWNKDYLRNKKDATGGDWYLTKLSYLGESFSRIAFEKYRQGSIDKATLAGHLNVRARFIDKFASYLG